MAKKHTEVIAQKKSQAKQLMNKKQIKQCNIAIHSASTASAIAGAIPIPVADALPITAAQVTMVLALGKVFDKKITESVAKGLIGAVASSFVGRSIVKMIPLLGWGISAAVAAGITEAIGWTIAVDFAKDAKNTWEKDHGFTDGTCQQKTDFKEGSADSAVGENNAVDSSKKHVEELIKGMDEFISGKKR